MTNEEAEELLAINARLTAEVGRLLGEEAQLREQLREAMARIAELEGRKPGPPSFVKPNRPAKTEPRGPRKKRAAEHNGSRQRATPTRIERHALERCPECQCRLGGESLDYSRQVVELPPPQPVEVIEHQVVKRWCPHCGQWRSPQLDLSGQVIGQGRIGVGVAALVAYLRTALRLPVRQVQTHLETMHDLHLSLGEIVALAHGVRRQLQGQADGLLAQLHTQPVVHQDETGWRENGRNGYVWTVSSAGPEAVRYYQHSFSRSHHVAQQLLGARFQGVLVSDFYAAYNLIPGRHQRCWVHLLRDLHELKAEHADRDDVVAWAQQVRQLYDEAAAWCAAQPRATIAERRQTYYAFHQRMCGLGQQFALERQHPCWALAKRVLRHQEELFQFVLDPEVPADNNLAERSLRPLVIMRKISGGTRSPAGSKTRLCLASLFETWHARGRNPFTACLAELQHTTQAPLAASP